MNDLKNLYIFLRKNNFIKEALKVKIISKASFISGIKLPEGLKEKVIEYAEESLDKALEAEIDNLLDELDEYAESNMLEEDDLKMFKDLVLDAESIEEVNIIRDLIPERLDFKEELDRYIEKGLSDSENCRKSMYQDFESCMSVAKRSPESLAVEMAIFPEVISSTVIGKDPSGRDIVFQSIRETKSGKFEGNIYYRVIPYLTDIENMPSDCQLISSTIDNSTNSHISYYLSPSGYSYFLDERKYE